MLTCLDEFHGSSIRMYSKEGSIEHIAQFMVVKLRCIQKRTQLSYHYLLNHVRRGKNKYLKCCRPFIRNPDAHLRPTFKDIYMCLSLHEDVVLAIPNQALLTHPQSGYLGAPLEAGKHMYLDLQNSYI